MAPGTDRTSTFADGPLQREGKLIQETYYLYSEIRHQVTVANNGGRASGLGVLLGETLSCEGSGEEIKFSLIEQNDY